MHPLFNAACYKLLAILSYTSGGYTHFAFDDFLPACHQLQSSIAVQSWTVQQRGIILLYHGHDRALFISARLRASS